jgi:hypothetical protein
MQVRDGQEEFYIGIYIFANLATQSSRSIFKLNLEIFNQRRFTPLMKINLLGSFISFFPPFVMDDSVRFVTVELSYL